jgi:hypothetical protein
MLPALSGMLPDSFQAKLIQVSGAEFATGCMDTYRAAGKMPAAAGIMPALP